MFDDQTPGQVPSNLPIGEPDDMFGGEPNEANSSDISAAIPKSSSENLSSAPSPAPQTRLPNETPSVAEPTALGAGVLRPKASVPGDETSQNYGQPTVTEGLRPEENVLRDPFGGRKVLITIISFLTLGILGGGGAWIYFSFINPSPEKLTPVINGTEPTTQPNTTSPEVVPPVTDTANTTTAPGTNNSSSSTDQRILFGEPVLDTDSDGLDDAAEKNLGTNMLAWDSDGDGLSDGDEVLTWKTDPLKADTDVDGYSDGEEIKNGYNPTGTGKLFPAPPAGGGQSRSTSSPEK